MQEPRPPQQSYPYAYPSYAPVATGTNGMAIASLVAGFLWLGWLGSFAAVVFGHVALSQIDQSQGRQGGRGMAIAGLALGYFGVATLALIIVLAAVR